MDGAPLHLPFPVLALKMPRRPAKKGGREAVTGESAMNCCSI
jgi:hypothetical protein